jgi:C-terminal processing protease CtpA/Prc
MKNIGLLILFLALFSINLNAQKLSASSFNLDFEKNTTEGNLPDQWIKWGMKDFVIQRDTNNVIDGKYSTVIYPQSNAKEESFGSVAHRLPANFKGKEIRLEGYMKTENVVNGFAGLVMRIDGEDNQPLEFNNMQNENIKGSNDWKRYTITLPFHEDAKSIYVAGILTGGGKAWFDKFEVYIDNKNIKDIEPVKRAILKAESDKEFDNGSNINIAKISNIQTNSLYKLGKIWGFVKYNHPEIAKGNINWDYELFRVMPNVLNATSEAKAEEIIAQWLQKVVPITASEKTKNEEKKDLKLTVRTDWFKNNAIVSPDLCKILTTLDNSEKLKKHYFVGFMPGVGNPIFSNEKIYSDLKYTDDGLKLLSLFRYWNMIEYFFPYRHLMDEDWDKVLKTYIPRMLEAKDELSYKLQLLEVIGKIQDTHANIWQSSPVLTHFWGNNIAPLEVKMIENKVVVTKVNTDAVNIKVGDIITAIDGQKVEKLIEEKAKYCPASNRPTQMRDVMRKFLRTNNSVLDLAIEGKENQKVTCENLNDRKTAKDETVSHKLLDGNIGYIYPGTLEQGEIDKIMKEFANTKGLVIDLRCYPSDFIVFSLTKYLMPTAKPFVKFTITNFDRIGDFYFRESLKVGTNESDYYKGKIAILINETTQSQAEYTTMALRVAPQVTVIGSTTAGADGNVSNITLPGNVKTRISGIGVYYPDGKETQRVGIVPDLEMRPTIQGVKNGVDELLNKAIEVVKK